MTLQRKGSFIRKAKDVSIHGALALSLLSFGLVPSGCSSKSEEADYSYEEVSYSKGIISRIKEVAPGEFRIMEEESVPADQARAIVSYLDGHTDTLSIPAAKALIDEEIKQNGTQVGHHSGLSSMLLYGGMGYMLGRSMNNGYINQYRDRRPDNTAFYGSPAAHSQAQTAFRDVNGSRTTRTVNARPSGGRSGFFGSRSSGSGG